MTVKKIETDIKEKFITKRDVINVCNKLKNAQDKFLVYAIYNGISGKKLEELRFLKHSDFCEKEKTIKIGEKTIIVDNFFEGLIKECENEKYYYINNGTVANGVKDKFEINLNSKYILKGKITSITDNGLSPIGYSSLQGRLNVISEIVGENITYNKLNRSKVVEEMCILKKEWRHKDVEKYLKENDLKFKASNILTIIKEVVNSDLLEDYTMEFNKCIKRICSSKLTIYQEESIQGLYKIITGLSIVNQIQRKKIENAHFRINESRVDEDMKNRATMQELIEYDKLYWEFIINEGFNTQEQEYLIKMYVDKEQYEKQNEIFYISCINGKYNIFSNLEYVGPGQIEDMKECEYTSKIFMNVVSWIIDEFDEIKREKRNEIIEKMTYTNKEKQSFTSVYLNDIGLDMILALNSGLEFKLAKKAFRISELLEESKGILKVTPCIDISTEGETYIVVITSDGSINHLKIDNTNEIKLYKTLGKNGRYEVFNNAEEMIRYFEQAGKEGISINECFSFEMEEEINKIKELKRALDILNSKNESDDLDKLRKEKNKKYLNYKMEQENEIIVSMYDYDLSIQYEVSIRSYLVKRYINIVGTVERIYEIYKTDDVEEMIKWLSATKENMYDDVEYPVFLI